MTASIEKREIGNLVVEGVPEIPNELNNKLRQYQNTREASIIGWRRGGEGMVISTRFGETAQFHLVKEAEGVREQLTFFNEPVFSANICPSEKNDGFVFLRDIGGNEAYQLFYFDFQSRNSTLLSDGVSKNSLGIWDRTGTKLAYSSTKLNGKDHNIFILDLKNNTEEELVLSEKGFWYPLEWSPDNTRLIVGHYLSIIESYLYVLDLKTGELSPFSSQNNHVASHHACWSIEGDKIFFTSDAGGQFRQLFVKNGTGNAKKISPELTWDVEAIELSPKGDQLAFCVNVDGFSKLYLLNTITYDKRLINTLPWSCINGLAWHPDNCSLGISFNTPESTSDVFVLNTKDDQLERWTKSELGGLDQDTFVKPELIHFQSFDQRKIPAFFYRPKKGKGPFSVLIYIHGGPESQYRPNFSPIFQFYLNELGVAILAPNVRGSSGYGKDYLRLDDGFKREDSVHDIGKLLDWIEKEESLDSSGVAVMGGSYGGYMVLASMTHYNDRLKCGIDVVGISNFVTFLRNTKPYRRDLRRVEYGDERDPKMREHLESISPTSNAHKITKPMLIVQGLNDPRVPVSEAEQMLKAIRKNGGEVWYLLAKDEGHGFRKKNNRDFYTKTVILFLQKNLLD